MSDWEIAERQEGLGKGSRVTYDVRKDRRTVSTGHGSEDGASTIVKRLRLSGEKVTLVEVDGYRTTITRRFEKRGWRRPNRRT